MTIHVRNWEKFQHADVAKNKLRAPAWIKTFTALLSDQNYTGLTGHRRAVLHGIWLEYASARGQLPDDTRTLTRRLDLKVTTADLEALVRAGFIELRHDTLKTTVGQPTIPDKKRQDKTVRSDVVEDVAALTGEQIEELAARGMREWPPVPPLNVDELAARRRPRAEVNGSPLGPLLDELLRRGATG